MSRKARLQLLNMKHMHKYEFHPVAEKDIEKIVKYIPSNKAAGHDRVYAKVLQDSLPVTLPVIINLINSSFTSNCFAKAWRPAQNVSQATLMNRKIPTTQLSEQPTGFS